MVGIGLALGKFRKGAKVLRWERKLKNPKEALNVIGLLIVSQSQLAFKEQKLGNDVWKPRAVPNVFGIIADFTKSANFPPSQRFKDRKALIDTTHLSRRIVHRVLNNTTVRIGTVVRYGSVHQTGGDVKSKKLTKKVQDRISDWIKRSRRPERLALQKYTHKRWRNKQAKMEVPARPFIGLTDQMKADIFELVKVRVMEVK